MTEAEARLALSQLDERNLDEREFAQVWALALSPMPELPRPAKDDIRAHLAPLVTSLKSKSGDAAQGHLQLLVYWRALHDVPLFKLERAALHFAAHAEWMPTPAEVRKQAEKYRHPAELARERARVLVNNRAHRVRDATVRAVRERELSTDALGELPDGLKDYLVKLGDLLRMPDGTVAYRSREALEAIEAHNRQLMLETRREA